MRFPCQLDLVAVEKEKPPRTIFWCSVEQKKASNPLFPQLEQRFFVSVPHTKHFPFIVEIMAGLVSSCQSERAAGRCLH